MGLNIEEDVMGDLTGLWEASEPGPFKADDSTIRREGEDFTIRAKAGYNSFGESHIRVWKRAKPDWADYRYVLGNDTDQLGGTRRLIYERLGSGRWKDLETGLQYPAHELRNVTPLAEVTE